MHEHGTTATDRDSQRRALRRSLVVLAVFFVVEAVTGLVTGSVALLGDAGHMLTDVLGMGMALGAMSAAARAGATSGPRTFGLYRLEVLAALVNAVLLTGLALWLLVESVRRIGEPPEVLGLPMLVVGALGLAANLLVLRWTTTAAGDSLNVQGARLEVLADTIGSVAVIVAAVVVQTTGFVLADTLAGLGIAAFVLPRTWRLGRRALRVLLQAAPEDVDPAAVTADLAALPHVQAVHDVHVWTLTSGMDVATAHLHLDTALSPEQSHDLLDTAHDLLRDRHGVDHATVQLEPPSHTECDPHREWSAR